MTRAGSVARLGYAWNGPRFVPRDAVVAKTRRGYLIVGWRPVEGSPREQRLECLGFENAPEALTSTPARRSAKRVVAEWIGARLP